jgi:hypothetical protein
MTPGFFTPSMAEPVDAELHEMDLSREPSHYAEIDGQQHRRHSEARYRHR